MHTTATQRPATHLPDKRHNVKGRRAEQNAMRLGELFTKVVTIVAGAIPVIAAEGNEIQD
jgi:hypothetical protein